MRHTGLSGCAMLSIAYTRSLRASGLLESSSYVIEQIRRIENSLAFSDVPA